MQGRESAFHSHGGGTPFYFTGLFTFRDARPEAAPVETPPSVRRNLLPPHTSSVTPTQGRGSWAPPGRAPASGAPDFAPAPHIERYSDAGSRVVLSFYEEQVERLKEPTPERARAPLG